jgi:hypothetical protein
MKKLILPLVMFFFIAACQDEETACYDCIVTETSEFGDKTETITRRCGLTESEARDIEVAGTIIYAVYTTPYIVAFQKKTQCVKVE